MPGPMLTWLAVESDVVVGRLRSHCRLVEIPPGSDVAPDLRQRVETPSARLIRSAPGPDLDEWYVVPASGPRSHMARVGRTVFWRPCGPGREHGLVRSLWCNCVAVTDAQVKRSPMRFALLRFAVPGCEARVAVAQG